MDGNGEPYVRGYGYLGLPVTRCVHFIRTHASGEFLEADIEAFENRGIKIAYWNYLDGGRQSTSVADPLAAALGLEHAPYGNLPWTQFLDDLITLAYRYDGLVIVIDRADLFIRERRDDMFDCLETFLHQFHHWYDQKKPCHLCFQMVDDNCVTEFFIRKLR
jgi:hypothetical protein